MGGQSYSQNVKSSCLTNCGAAVSMSVGGGGGCLVSSPSPHTPCFIKPLYLCEPRPDTCSLWAYFAHDEDVMEPLYSAHFVVIYSTMHNVIANDVL